ncbi:MAG TPA: carbon-nitrogen hydrolase family protein [Bryobacteraceae bacterium]|nr:carbon-nitrogen hydrolase family protein [Bryobacteraceae bacterium]
MAFTVALLQIESCGRDQSRNLEKGLRFCRDAKSRSADLVVFPELWNIGSAGCPIDAIGRQRWISSAIDGRSDFLRSFADLAKDLDINIAITYLEAYRPKPRNSVSIIDRRGEVVLNYSKVFICDFGQEELLKTAPDPQAIGCDVNCSAGDSFDVCTLTGEEDQAAVGAMICSDREFPEPATQLMLNGAELIVVPNSCTWDEVRAAGLKTRAFDNMVGIAMANYPGPGAGASQAYTCVAWRRGDLQDTLLAKAGEKEEMLLIRFDIDAIRKFRAAESWRMDYRRRGLRRHIAT